jgi:hypothetical protein
MKTEEMISFAYDSAKNGYNREYAIGMLRALYFRDNIKFNELEAINLVDQGFVAFERERREAQRQLSREIGEGRDLNTPPRIETITLEAAINRFVLVSSARAVVDMDQPTRIFGLTEFCECYAGSWHQYTNNKGQFKTKSVPKSWLEAPGRRTVDALTWSPGHDIITRSPDGQMAINTWREHKITTQTDDLTEKRGIFVKHVEFIFGADASKFLDWCAHIFQKPGELPSFGFVHIAREHGLGRNWISAVLARLMPGNVAASLDLVGMLNSNYNERLSHCLLAIVDEIHVGGSSDWRHSNKLREIITADRRHINPKYGRQRVEFNCCRWLILSNHTGAVPLDEKDRRFYVVQCLEKPRSSDYYKRIYAALHDREFIAGVGAYLKNRDISSFNCGERPPMNEAKQALISASKSEADHMSERVASHWPVDIIYLSEFSYLLDIHSNNSRYLAHVLDRAGIKRLTLIRTTGGYREVAYAIRNNQKYATPEQIRAEHDRLSDDEKKTALYDDVVPPPPCHRVIDVNGLTKREPTDQLL